LQKTLIALRMVKSHRPWPEAKQSIDKTIARINQMAGSPVRLRYWLSMISIPNFQRATDTGMRMETEWQLTRTAVALKRYQLRDGKLPPGLEALVPEFLPALPYDPMSGKPLCYRLKPDGSFVLYSVGEDGKDDGGDPNPASGAKCGLWEGRDAVWPSAAN
jgi:hypothetical protein